MHSLRLDAEQPDIDDAAQHPRASMATSPHQRETQNSCCRGQSTTKGHFLLLTAHEVLDSLSVCPSASSLNEAYADAAFFKYSSAKTR